MLKTNELCESCKYNFDTWCTEKRCRNCERDSGLFCKCLQIKINTDCADYEPREEYAENTDEEDDE